MSYRLRNWDYGWPAQYFITICTLNRICWFGEIIDGEMKLSENGKIVQAEWLRTFELRKDMNLSKGEYVVMPNHFHAIISIGHNEHNTSWKPIHDPGRIAMHGNPAGYKNQFGPQSKNLASIIRGFKSAVTINIRSTHPTFAWQPRFHDHIIRNEYAYRVISSYIISDPSRYKGY